MGRLLHPIFALLASVTRQELACQVAYLREENRILRARLPQRLVDTPQEGRRLILYQRFRASASESRFKFARRFPDGHRP